MPVAAKAVRLLFLLDYVVARTLLPKNLGVVENPPLPSNPHRAEPTPILWRGTSLRRARPFLFDERQHQSGVTSYRVTSAKGLPLLLWSSQSSPKLTERGGLLGKGTLVTRAEVLEETLLERRAEAGVTTPPPAVATKAITATAAAEGLVCQCL